MASHILATIASWIIGVISSLGYGGIILLMAISAANIPIPSEVIMPFSGFLVFQGTFNLYLTALMGAIGCVVGSSFSYFLGSYVGRPLVEKYGKFILISHHDLDLADRWFGKHGEATVFFGRFLPVITTFISFPAGISRMNYARFIIYSFFGSLLWSLFLAFIGLKLGENWGNIKNYTRGFDWLILALIIIGIIWWIWRHLRQNSKSEFRNSKQIQNTKRMPKGK